MIFFAPFSSQDPCFSVNYSSFFSYLQNLVYILESVFYSDALSIGYSSQTYLHTACFWLPIIFVFILLFTNVINSKTDDLLASPSSSPLLCVFPLNSFLLFVFYFYDIDLYCFVAVCCE